VGHIDAARLKRLRAVDDEIGAALRDGDVGAYMARNFEFHFLIYRALPRPTLIQLIETLWLQFGPYMRVVYGRFGTSRLDDQHERALAAIRDRNGPALRRAVLADIRDGMSLIAKNGFEKEA
jgi:DNA-binding GntR family transcriptional regulator